MTIAILFHPDAHVTWRLEAFWRDPWMEFNRVTSITATLIKVALLSYSLSIVH